MARDPRETTLDGQPVYATALRGRSVLRHPLLNKGTSFTPQERQSLGLHGLLPALVTTDMELQLSQAYERFCSIGSNLAKHIYMWDLHDDNATLFFALVQRHLLEMLPIIYDPTVGEAIESFSEIWRRPRGVYLSITEPGTIREKLASAYGGNGDIDLLVATDAEEILGIGDWGANGIDIAIGKLAVYTAAAGVNPHRVIPVMLDVGTDNERLLNDPAYIGVRHSRVRGQQYFDFIEEYVDAAKELFPGAVLHWEDFGCSTARVILDHHRAEVATFNDDMQGTGAVAIAGLINAIDITGVPWREHTVVVVGGGTAGCGIADQIVEGMVRDGATREQALEQVYVVDLPGLLTDDMEEHLLEYQKPYAKPAAMVTGWDHSPAPENIKAAARWPEMAELRDARSAQGIVALATVVEHVQPSILIGTSTTPGMFTEAIVRSMAAAHDRPIIFPLSNPTRLAEATPEHIITWSDGRALVATGSPFADVEFGGVTHQIGQANNAALYPGLGFGAIVCKAKTISDGMLFAAAQAVASQAELSRPGASLLPSNARLRETSSVVAVHVIKRAIAEGNNGVDVPDPVEAVRAAAWWPVYRGVVAEG